MAPPSWTTGLLKVKACATLALAARANSNAALIPIPSISSAPLAWHPTAHVLRKRHRVVVLDVARVENQGDAAVFAQEVLQLRNGLTVRIQLLRVTFAKALPFF